MKKVLTALTLLVFSSVYLFSQSDKFSLGFELMPQLSNGVTAVNDHNTEATFSYSLGPRVEYKIKPNLILRSGLLFSNKRSKVLLSNLRWGLQHDGQGGFDPNASSGEATEVFLNNQFRYIEIPFGILINLSKSSVNKFYLHPGVSGLVNIGKEYRSIGKDTDGNTLYNRKSNESVNKAPGFSIYLAGGYKMTIQEKTTFFIEPKFDWIPFGQINFTDHYFSFGLSTGILF